MRKTLLTALTLFLGSFASGSLWAQTLLDEDFEGVGVSEKTDRFPDGWTTENGYTGNKMEYHWYVTYSASNSLMSGHHYASVSAPTYGDKNSDGVGPREEKLITPELSLDDTYQLSFDWYSAGAAVFNDKAYTFQVRVLNTATGEWTTVWDFTNKEQVRNSGVPASQYNDYIGWLWDAWTVYNSKLDLSAFKGQKVKVAFVYKLNTLVGNLLCMDNVSVKKFTPLTGPVAQVNNSSYNYGEMYVGEKFYSEAFRLKNAGLPGLRITGFEAPEGITFHGDTANMNLGINEEAAFQIGYKASLTTPAVAKAVVKTNGGDVELTLRATKKVVPEGYNLESFEGRQFPPAGWANEGWGSTAYALEGDNSAYAGGSITDLYLTSPRLDLSDAKAPRDVKFTYYLMFSDDEGNAPNNDLVVEASDDCGKTWTSVFTSDYTKTDTLIHVTVDLSAFKTDSVLVRWKDTAIEYDSESGAAAYGTYFLDRVLLPAVYGAGGVPGVAPLVSPKDSLADVYARNLQLKWTEAQFADGYKLYVGKSDKAFDVIDGLDVGDTTCYTMTALDYATTYFWKVVPYNAAGTAANVPVWRFTTQADHTVKAFPWAEQFEGAIPPLGWNIESSATARWSDNTYYPYDGKASMTALVRGDVGYANLCTPDIVLPAGSDLHVSFWWGNDICVSLKKDDSSVRVNEFNKEYDGYDAGYFDILVDGEWKQLTMISNPNDDQYWVYENISLAPYAGKTVALRWRYVATNYNRCRGLSLDNVAISDAAADVKFNTDRWDAFKTNANSPATSAAIALTNLGSVDATVTDVKFAKPNFSTTLQKGETLGSGKSVLFTVTFDAKGAAPADSAYISDNLVVTLSDGTEAKLPVSGVALADDILFYGFEGDKTGTTPAGLTVIDADGGNVSSPFGWTTPGFGSPRAFFVINDAECYNFLKEPHGHQSLMTRCNSGGAGDDWLVSPLLTIGANSNVQFDARAAESVNSILPSGTPTISVLVSERSATSTGDFVKVAGEKLEYFDNKSWTHFNVDLSAYAGKNVYVAIQAKYDDSFGGFLDNVEYGHVTDVATAIGSISADRLAGADVTVYRLDGTKVAQGKGALGGVVKGLYVVKAGNRSFKVVK